MLPLLLLAFGAGPAFTVENHCPPFTVVNRVPAPKAKPTPAVVQVWDWEGNLNPTTDFMRQHLVKRHGYTADQVNAMSRAELIAAHDGEHNAKAHAAIVPQSSCPSGNCPLNQPQGSSSRLFPRLFR